MLFYVPPLLPVRAEARDGLVGQRTDRLFPDVDEARAPFQVPRQPLRRRGHRSGALRPAQAARAVVPPRHHRRRRDQPTQAARWLAEADCTAAEAETIYPLTALAPRTTVSCSGGPPRHPTTWPVTREDLCPPRCRSRTLCRAVDTRCRAFRGARGLSRRGVHRGSGVLPTSKICGGRAGSFDGQLQELYTEHFDLNESCTMDIGWHLFGDGTSAVRFWRSFCPPPGGRHRRTPGAAGPPAAPSRRLSRAEPARPADLRETVRQGVEKLTAALHARQSPLASRHQRLRCGNAGSVTMRASINLLLFVVLPYAAALLFTVGAVERYRRHRSSVTSLSSQFFESRRHFWALMPFHLGLLAVLAAHLVWLIAPGAVHEWNRRPGAAAGLEIAALACGLTALGGYIAAWAPPRGGREAAARHDAGGLERLCAAPRPDRPRHPRRCPPLVGIGLVRLHRVAVSLVASPVQSRHHRDCGAAAPRAQRTSSPPGCCWRSFPSAGSCTCCRFPIVISGARRRSSGGGAGPRSSQEIGHEGFARAGLTGATIGFFVGFAAVALFGPTAARSAVVGPSSPAAYVSVSSPRV